MIHNRRTRKKTRAVGGEGNKKRTDCTGSGHAHSESEGEKRMREKGKDEFCDCREEELGGRECGGTEERTSRLLALP